MDLRTAYRYNASIMEYYSCNYLFFSYNFNFNQKAGISLTCNFYIEYSVNRHCPLDRVH